MPYERALGYLCPAIFVLCTGQALCNSRKLNDSAKSDTLAELQDRHDKSAGIPSKFVDLCMCFYIYKFSNTISK